MYNKNAWTKYSDEEKKIVMDFSEGYKAFLSAAKTERLAVKEAVKIAEAKGFKPLDSFKTLKPGDKVYKINKNKNLAAFIIGDKPVASGLRVLGAHIDSPRIDVKQNPLYEQTEQAYLDTHYYGGIKKYQYVTIPLALHGVVVKKDGTSVEVHIGEDLQDPVLGITDLLIHLSANQMQKSAASVIEGEKLDLSVGSIPTKDGEKDSVKATILKFFKDNYDIEEEDFLSAELEIVPAGPARDYGLDRSMVAGYGQDDRVCAYTSLMAIVDLEDKPEYTSCCILVDKEEVGSIGATGAQSKFFENVVAELVEKTTGTCSFLDASRAMENTMMLSSDVSAGYDPLYPEVNEAKNSSYFAHGITFNKYTGARGKSGCNDANPEFIAKIRKVLDDENINWQTAELGRVDQGGGGTIAYILGNYNMNVIDAGVPVFSMHSPMEITSKADIFEAYKAYKVFLLKL
jgi:aspartyl aminopeptidase